MNPLASETNLKVVNDDSDKCDDFWNFLMIKRGRDQVQKSWSFTIASQLSGRNGCVITFPDTSEGAVGSGALSQ